MQQHSELTGSTEGTWIQKAGSCPGVHWGSQVQGRMLGTQNACIRHFFMNAWGPKHEYHMIQLSTYYQPQRMSVIDFERQQGWKTATVPAGHTKTLGFQADALYARGLKFTSKYRCEAHKKKNTSLLQ